MAYVFDRFEAHCLRELLSEHDITNQLSSSISKIPSVLRDVSPDSYTPGMVSIGPLHYTQQNLITKHKIPYIQKLLHLSSSSLQDKFQECIDCVVNLSERIKACYAEIGAFRSADDLTLIMAMDACFILGFLNSQPEEVNLNTVNVCKDLLLLENQIPFFVIEEIFKCTILKYNRSASLTEIIIPLLNYGHRLIFRDHNIIPSELLETSHHDHTHILSLLHKCYSDHVPERLYETTNILNAMELEKAGVSFSPNTNLSWPLEIEVKYSRVFPWFWSKPTIKLPILHIQEGTRDLLLNLIAYEQTSKVDPYFTSFMDAIDDLIDTGYDMAKLVESKVIINDLESNEEAAHMIINICKNAVVCNYYSKQWKEVDAYYNRGTTLVRRTYFSNPWNIINLFAGIILFFLSAIQTYFTINPRK